MSRESQSDHKGSVGASSLGTELNISQIQHNTTIPSSATVERLFSAGRDIRRDKRAWLSDANFEKLMSLRGNQHLGSTFHV